MQCGRGVDLESLLGMIQRDDSDRRLYVLLHNIDGPGAAAVDPSWCRLLSSCLPFSMDCRAQQLLVRCDPSLVSSQLMFLNSNVRSRYLYEVHVSQRCVHYSCRVPER